MKRKKYEPDERFGFTGIDGCSRLTGWSTSSLYKAIAKKEIPHYKIGGNGKILFKIEEIKSWIESTKQSVAGE